MPNQTGRSFFVDTLAEPHRAIWVHPLDDPEFIRLHRTEEDARLDSDDDDSHLNTRPPSSTSVKAEKEYPRDEKKPHHDDDHLKVPSKEGAESSRPGQSRTESQGDEKGKKRGFFGKLKDRAIGTKEEREAARKAREARHREEERLYYERRDALLALRMQQIEQERAAYERAGTAYPYNGPYGYGRQPMQPPQMNAYGGPTYQNPIVYGQSPYANQRRGGGGGTALVGGLLGGLLLGKYPVVGLCLSNLLIGSNKHSTGDLLF